MYLNESLNTVLLLLLLTQFLLVNGKLMREFRTILKYSTISLSTLLCSASWDELVSLGQDSVYDSFSLQSTISIPNNIAPASQHDHRKNAQSVSQERWAGRIFAFYICVDLAYLQFLRNINTGLRQPLPPQHPGHHSWSRVLICWMQHWLPSLGLIMIESEEPHCVVES